MATLTVNDILKKKQGFQKSEKKTVYLKSLDGEIAVEKIPLHSFMSFLDLSGGREDFQAQIDLIYSCCPIMRNKELQDAFDCKEPTDIVCRMLNDSLGDINALVLAITSMYDIRDNIETVKN